MCIYCACAPRRNRMARLLTGEVVPVCFARKYHQYNGVTSVSKLMTMREAIARYVPDGSSVALGLALEPCIPFAAGHEIIRQNRRDLTLVGPISDILFDQLIGAG